MTEDEATTKWCPFARLTIHSPGVGLSAAFNRSNGPADDNRVIPVTRCIGSACMAWRRQKVMINRATGLTAPSGLFPDAQMEERYSGHGFCGLAGPL